MRKILLTIAIAVLSTITAFGQFFTEDFNDFTWGDYTWEDDGSGGWTGDGAAKDWTFQEGFIIATSYGGNQIKHWGVGGSEGDPIFAGGSGAEAKLDGHLGTDWPTDYERTARFISPTINTTGMTDVSVSFTHSVERYDTYEDVFTIGVATTSDGGSSWTTIWSQDIPPYEGFDQKSETFTIDNFDVGSANFQICFFMDGNPYPIQHWSFDDIEMFVLPDTDILVQEIENKPQYTQGESFDPSVRIINLGVLPTVNFDLQYKITQYGSGTVVYDETQSVTLNKGDVSSVTLPAHSFSASGQVYTTEVTATVTGDANPSDNFATKEMNTWTQGRQYVLVESSTYLTCGSCPYAASALKHIHEEGILPMAAIEHHTSSDPSPQNYTNSYAQGRLVYLSTTGAPQTYFDGTNMISGGCGGDCITPYEDGINNAMTLKSPIRIGIESSEIASSGVFDAIVTVTKLETVSKDNLRLAFVLTESHIDEIWGSPQQTTLETVNRRMYPDENGQVIDLENSSSIIKNFSIDATAYAKENCDLIAFVYDYETKEVYQTQMVHLGETATNLNKLSSNSFTVYPNPSKGIINVKLPVGNNEKFQIKSLVGQTLLEGYINNGNNTIDISSLSNGNYLLIVNNTVKKILLIK